MTPRLRIIFPSPGVTLEPGDALCWLQAGPHPVALPAPLAGTLLRINDHVRRRPDLACSSPLDRGWLVELEPACARMPASLQDAAGARRRSAEDHRFVHHLLSQRHPRDERLGTTLADGGALLGSLQEMLGSDRFAALLRKVLH